MALSRSVGSGFDGYLDVLRRVDADVGYGPVDDLFFANPCLIAEGAALLNQELGVEGDPARRFQSDVPLLGLGGWRGLVLMSANPGWRDEAVDPRNKKEDEYRRTSAQHCKQFTREFFEIHREVLGERLRFWSRPISLLGPLIGGWERIRSAAGMTGSGPPKTTAERWSLAHRSRLLGGWELLPWHSAKDGFSSGVIGPDARPLVRKLCEESLRAAVRAQPEVLLVASSAGYRLVTTVLEDAQWEKTTLTGRDGVKVPLARGILDGVASASPWLATLRALSARDSIGCHRGRLQPRASEAVSQNRDESAPHSAAASVIGSPRTLPPTNTTRLRRAPSPFTTARSASTLLTTAGS